MITFDPDGLKKRIAELEADMGRPGFWDDQQHAASVSTEHSRLSRRLERYERLRGDYDDAAELAAMDGDMEAEIAESIRPLRRELARLEEEALFTGDYDAGDAIVTIVGGTGGTDAQDWAEILLRMSLRWAAERGFQAELLEASPGEEAGLKSATFTVKGENAYGALRAERGVHRLVRLSPFDQAHRRHTSFAQVIVSPLVADDTDVEIDEADLRVDTYRASGAGGQHVNKTDSAVRITHFPSGIVVTSSLKSQHQNRDIAMQALKSRLYQMELEKRTAAIQEAHENKGDAGWGNQIRSYVLQPYQMVKDLRTGYETSDTQGVLDGDLDAFMAATLAMDVSGKSRADAQAED